MDGQDYAPYMREAISLARSGQFATYPNPSVGAVLLKDGQIVARGWHKGSGSAHAEIECLANARDNGLNPEGCAMVVTLEPCRHHGKTPPCVEALSAAGIKRLVYGCADPNPEASGGAAILAEQGMEVIGPVLERECLDLIADFTVWQNEGRPYVILKLASTLDGRIATRTGHSQWVSNESSRNRVHDLRTAIGACGGSILIGGGTFRADNPQLSARSSGKPAGAQPFACILTSRLPRADADFHLLRERPEQTIFFASPAAAASTTAESLRKAGCRVEAIGPGMRGQPDFFTMFRHIRSELGSPYVLCEGGGKLAMSLLDAGYVDEFHLHLSPKILGDDEARPLFQGRAPLSMDEALNLRICSVDADGGDLHVVLRPDAPADNGRK